MREALPLSTPGLALPDPEAQTSTEAPGLGKLLRYIYGLALVAFFLAPLLALSWRVRPFPGFVVEQTLVVSDYFGNSWPGTRAGLAYPQRVTHVMEQLVTSSAQFEEAVGGVRPGAHLSFRTLAPTGETRIYRAIQSSPFPDRDLIRLFWLPYGIGLVFLAQGWWIYRLRGHTRPGRAFAYFCVCAALSSALLFDLITTHRGAALWTVAIAQVGGAMTSLALLFPTELEAVRRRPWMRFLPYGLSFVLAANGLATLQPEADPWAYVAAWRLSYGYAALGILIFLAMLILRLRQPISGLPRQQARIILAGSFLAFIPLGAWLGAPAFGVMMRWNPILFLPPLAVFPLSIGLAIGRYRLWDIDVLINRTLVYGVLTAVLAAAYFGTLLAFEQIFRGLILGTSRLSGMVSTLTLAVLFFPVRQRVQNFVDQRFYRRRYDAARTLAVFGTSLREDVEMDRVVDRLESVIQETLQPQGVCTWLRQQDGLYVLHASSGTFGHWEHLASAPQVVAGEDLLVGVFLHAPGVLALDQLEISSPLSEGLRRAGASLVVPLQGQGELWGWLCLGPRRSEEAYSFYDLELLGSLAAQAAPAVRVVQLAFQQQVEALERERLAQEMQVARLIQETLLPRGLPQLTGWQLNVHWQPAQAVGGDFYDFLALPDGRLSLLVGDVSGKGVPAALVMATTRAVLRGSARRGLSPGQALARTNEIMVHELPPGMFITCLYAILDPASGHFQYANAGHDLPYRRSTGGVDELRATGMPLGLMPEMTYEEKEAFMAPGECLLLYSDGLIEAHNPAREMFGVSRLKGRLAQFNGPGGELIRLLLSDLAGFTGTGWEQEDDITLLTIQRVFADD